MTNRRLPSTAAYLRYGLAVLLAVGAVALCVALLPLTGDKAPFVLSSLAVLVASRYGGRNAGFVATFCATVTASFFAPKNALGQTDRADVVAAVIFIAVGASISIMNGKLRDALTTTAENEKRYREILEALPLMVWTSDADGNCDHVTSQWEGYTGLSRSRLLGHGWMQTIHSEDQQAVAEEWQRTASRGLPWRMEIRLRRHDGAWRWFDARATPLRNAEGTVVKWVGTSLDIQQDHDLREMLRGETERFAVVAGVIPGVIYTYHRSPRTNGQFLYISPQLDDLCGIRPEDVRDDATPFFDRVHPDDLPALMKSIRKAGRERTPWRGEFRLHHPDKGEIWIEGMSRPSQTPIDGYVLWCGVMTDVTARRREQETAREWQRAFEQTALAIGLSNAHSHTIKAVNEAFARLHGYTREELIGKPPAFVYPPEARAGLAASIREVDDGSGHVIFESLQRRKDGSCFPVTIDLTAVRDETGRIASRVAIIQDLTERRRMEDQLRRSEALYRAISDNLPASSVFVVDRELRYQAVAGRLAEALGLPGSAGMTGRRMEEILQGRTYELARQRFLRAFDGEAGSSEDATQGLTLLTHFIPLRDAGGRVESVMALIQDVTAQREAERQIRRMNEELELRVRSRTLQLEAANREHEAFAWSVSHDLRAPLRGLDGWSQALREDCGDLVGEKGMRYLDRIRSEAQRMAALIDSLLDLSRLSRSEMKWQPVDITAIAQRQARLLAAANPERQIRFAIEPGLEAQGDPRLLEIALTNLLENAVKFTSRLSAARIEVGRAMVNGETEFFVRDNGAGFDMAHAAHLFGAFQRLHRTSEFPGMGIGLATVQRVIHRHGGRIHAEAAVGEGARFLFTLGSPPETAQGAQL